MKKIPMFLLAIVTLVACNNNKNPRGLDERGDEGGWTNKVRNKYLKECTDEGVSKKICSCVLTKLEKKYTVDEVEDLSEAVGEKLAKECLGGDEDDVYGDEDDFGTKKKKDDDEDSGGRWTNQQRNSYIQECATAAETNLGFTSDQANSFCDCMTRKVEKKHSYKEANRMTANDFSTQEWEDARADCKSGN